MWTRLMCAAALVSALPGAAVFAQTATTRDTGR